MEQTGHPPQPIICGATNEQVVYFPGDNYRNQSSWCISWTKGQDLRWELTWLQKRLASISPFQDYPIITRTLIQAGVASSKLKKNLNTFPTSFQTISNKITCPVILLNNLTQVMYTCPTLKLNFVNLERIFFFFFW